MTEVFVSTLTYEQYLSQQWVIKERTQRSANPSLENPNPDDIPEDLVDLGVVFGITCTYDHISRRGLEESLSDLKKSAAEMNAEYIFNVKLKVVASGKDDVDPCGDEILVGEAYKRKEHR